MESKRLFVAVDAALQPSGVVPDLSRIIVEYAQSPKWDANCPDVKSGALALDAEGTVRIVRHDGRFRCVLAHCTIPDLPPPSDQSRAHLRQWTIQFVKASAAVCPGIAKLSSHPSFYADPVSSWTISTHASWRWHGPGASALGLPFSQGDAAGSLYHFTADLASGELRVRPVIMAVSPDHKPLEPSRTEWTIARIADLSSYRLFAEMTDEGTACTLILSEP